MRHVSDTTTSEILKTEPTVEPVAVQEVKDYLRIDHDDEDALITDFLIKAVREEAEKYMSRALLTQTWQLFLDDWPVRRDPLPWWEGVQEGADIPTILSVVELPHPPLISVVVANQFNEEDVATVWPVSNYFVDAAATPGRLVLRTGGTIPIFTRVANGFEIEYTAGYGATPEEVPSAIRWGILQACAWWYENRGDSAKMMAPGMKMAIEKSGAAALWEQYRWVFP